MSSKEIVAAGSTAIVAMPAREPGESNTPYMARMADLLPPPPENVAELIADLILEAESMMDQNELWEATGSQTLVNRPFVWQSISMQPSSYKDGLPFFLVCHVVDSDTGEAMVITTGSRNIVAALLYAHFHNALPWQGTIIASKPNPKTGNIALHMRWDARVVGA